MGVSTTNQTSTDKALRTKWGTPAEFFWLEIQPRYRLQIDAASDDKDYLLVNHWTEKEDGLKQKWTGKRVWCNPPYGRGIDQWVRKAYETSSRDPTDVGISVLLLPPDIDTAWFHDFIEEPPWVHHWFYRGRLKFNDPEGRNRNQPTAGNLIAVFLPEHLFDQELPAYAYEKGMTINDRSIAAKFDPKPYQVVVPGLSGGLFESDPDADCETNREGEDHPGSDGLLRPGEAGNWARVSVGASGVRVWN